MQPGEAGADWTPYPQGDRCAVAGEMFASRADLDLLTD